jgi:hypothetical protein
MDHAALMDELAYRSAVNGGVKVRGFADSKGLTRQQYVELVAHPDFEPLLSRYLRAFVELPWQKALHERRMSAGLTGGLAALETAIASPTRKVTLTETSSHTRTLEGPMEEILAAFSSSLRDNGRSSLFPSGKPGPNAREREDAGIREALLEAGGEGGDGDGERPAVSERLGAGDGEVGVGAEPVRDLGLHPAQEAEVVPRVPLQGEVLPRQQSMPCEREPDPDASGLSPD